MSGTYRDNDKGRESTKVRLDMQEEAVQTFPWVREKNRAFLADMSSCILATFWTSFSYKLIAYYRREELSLVYKSNFSPLRFSKAPTCISCVLLIINIV